MSKEKFLKEVNRLKGTKTNLKAQKVALAAFDEIFDNLGQAEFLVLEAFTETMDEGDAAYMLGRDIMRFDFQDARSNAEQRMDDVKATLDELGVDYPPQMEEAITRLDDLNTEENRSRDRFQKWDAIY
jgi:hypothetical protein